MVDDERGGATWTVAFSFLAAFAFALPWRHAVTIRPGVSIGPAIAAALATAWIVTALRTRTVRRPHAFHLALGLFTALSMASLLWTVDAQRTFFRAATLGYVFALTVVAWDILDTRGRIAVVSQALVLGTFVVGAVGVVEVIQQGGLADRRDVVYGANANELARWVVLATPLAAGLLVNSRRFGDGLAGYVNVGYLVATPFVILATGSRQGGVAFVALVILGVFVVARYGRSLGIRPRQVLAGVGFLVLAIVSIESIASLSIFLERLPYEPSRLGSAGGRTAIWAEGLAAFRANPLLGVGAGAYSAVTPPGMSADPHNTFVGVAVELGLVGLSSFLLVAAIPLGVALTTSGPTYTSVGIYLALVLFASVAMLYNDPFNWLLVLVVLAAHSVPSADREHEPVAPVRQHDRDANAVETLPD